MDQLFKTTQSSAKIVAFEQENIKDALFVLITSPPYPTVPPNNRYMVCGQGISTNLHRGGTMLSFLCVPCTND